MTLGRDPRRLVLLLVIIVLAAATAFGLWHVIIGGLIGGNPRAGVFGVILGAVAGTVLATVIVLGRRIGRA